MQTKNDVDGEQNRVVRLGDIWGNKEGTIQELLEATHYTRPNNGWMLTKTRQATSCIVDKNSRRQIRKR